MKGVPMKIAICDDCREDVLRLKPFLTGHDVREFLRANELLSEVDVKHTFFDLYFLDIFMDSIDGIELAQALRSRDPEAFICFVSTSNDFYREAYDVYAIQYLLKPVQREEVERLMERVASYKARQKERGLFVKGRKSSGVIPYGKILYISSCEHTLSIHCKDGTVHECIGKLNEMEAQLCGDIFCRCHQSFLVNLYQVDSLSGNDLIIAGSRIPVSRRYYAEVRHRYQEILFEEVE